MRTLGACKAGVTEVEGARTKHGPVSETKENKGHALDPGPSRKELCAAGGQRLHSEDSSTL